MIVSETWLKAISYLLMFIFITIIIPLHLFPCFIAGFLTYEMSISLLLWFERRLVGRESGRLVVMALIAVVFLTIVLIIGIVHLIIG